MRSGKFLFGEFLHALFMLFCRYIALVILVLAVLAVISLSAVGTLYLADSDLLPENNEEKRATVVNLSSRSVKLVGMSMPDGGFRTSVLFPGCIVDLRGMDYFFLQDHFIRNDGRKDESGESVAVAVSE